MLTRTQNLVNQNLWSHQRQMIDFALERPRSIWACGMGTGKTRAAISLAREAGCRLILVATPLAVIDAFSAEVSATWPEASVVTTKGSGTAPKRQDAILRAIQAAEGPIFVIGNLESLRLMPALLGLSWGLYVADECHRLKSHSGKASKWSAKVKADKTVGLSGTILGQSPIDAFGTWRALGLGHRFPRTLTAFRDRYAVMHPTIRGWVTGWKNLDEFESIVSQDMIQFRSSDVLDLPGITESTIYVDLSPAERRVHKELKDELVFTGDDGRVVMPENPLVAVLRMLQACSGWISYDGERAERIQPVSSKRRALADLMTDVSEPAVIWYRFSSELEDILEVCPDAMVLSGSRDDLSAWQQGSGRILAAQYQAGGTGTNMTRARVAIYYSQTPSVVDYEQSRCRLHRPGQSSHVSLVNLVSRGTAEELLVKGRTQKCDLLERILQGLV